MLIFKLLPSDNCNSLLMPLFPSCINSSIYACWISGMPDNWVQWQNNDFHLITFLRGKYDLVITMYMVHFLDITYENEKVMQKGPFYQCCVALLLLLAPLLWKSSFTMLKSSVVTLARIFSAHWRHLLCTKHALTTIQILAASVNWHSLKRNPRWYLLDIK